MRYNCRMVQLHMLLGLIMFDSTNVPIFIHIHGYTTNESKSS